MCLQVYQLRVTTRSLLANASQALAAREPPVDYATGKPDVRAVRRSAVAQLHAMGDV